MVYSEGSGYCNADFRSAVILFPLTKVLLHLFSFRPGVTGEKILG